MATEEAGDRLYRSSVDYMEESGIHCKYNRKAKEDFKDCGYII